MSTPRKRGGKSAKQKGDAFERELVAHFNTELGLTASRAYFTFDPIEHDGAQDLIGIPGLAIEAKRVETLSFPAALKQAITNAKGGDIPVVINRRNRQRLPESYTLLRLEDFMRLYAAYLQLNYNHHA